jgi:UDP-N-acetylmuramate--alanine ligase
MKKPKKIFFLGLKGVAMAGLAIISKKMGYEVTGSDEPQSFITDIVLKKHSIKCITSFDPDLITKDIDIFIYSAAHNGEKNPQTQQAKKMNIKIYNQAEYISKLLKEFKNTVAITGSHGKTTTSSLLAFLMIELGTNPSYLTGSSGFNNFPGGDFQKKDFFIFEADEYAVDPPNNNKIKLSYYYPDDIIITNIDFDHPDVYSSIKDSETTFIDFLKRGKNVFYCQDNQLLSKAMQNNFIKNSFSFGFDKNSYLKISSFSMNKNGSVFNLTLGHYNLGSFKTKLFGRDNVSNITGTVLYLLKKGFNVKDIKKALLLFTGPKRRFEKIYEVNNIILYDDYAHHPTEITSIIETCRKIFKNKKLVVLFHPHTYSRTKTFLSGFAQSLQLADYSIILPIFSSAREKYEEYKISSFDIVKSASGKVRNLKAVKSKDEALNILSKIIKKGDVILTMGAGDVYLTHDKIISLIKNIK